MLGFIDDGEPDSAPVDRLGAQLVGDSSDLPDYAGACYCIGIGSASGKRRFAQVADAAGLSAVALVHPTAVIDPDVEIGPGSAVGRLTVLATNVRVGSHTTVATQSSVAHDCRIGDFSFIAQGAILAGGVHVSDDAFRGVASACHQGSTIGQAAVVGMGAVVLDDVAGHTTVLGVPARSRVER